MLRLPAALFTGIALLVLLFAGQVVSAQSSPWQITSVTPASTRSGSGNTLLTVSGTQPGNVVQNYQLCFYTGTNSNSIAASSSNAGQATSNFTFTFNIPASSLIASGAASSASIYLSDQYNTTTCTGTNPSVSNTYTYSITPANYTVNSASPSTLPSGSPDTSIAFAGTFPTFPADGSGLGLCFYAGSNNAPLLPTSQSGTTSATFTVPSANFSNAATASVYLAPATGTCTGTNPGFSTTLSYPISQGMRFNITDASPGSFPAASGDVAITLDGSLSGTGTPNNGVCFYTGPGSTPATITPTSFTASQIVFTAPASAFLVNPSSFADGTYTAQVYLGLYGQTCTGTNEGISNVFSLPITLPNLDAASLPVLSQSNPTAPTAPYPRTLELTGSSFNTSSSTAASFVSGGGSATIGTGRPLDSTRFVASIPYSSTASSLAVSLCNRVVGNTASYCSNSINIPTFSLATTTTQLASTPATPALNSSATLTATITPGAGSSTPGGTYVPGPPTGTVIFKDGQTTLGTAALTASALAWSNSSSQVINTSGGDGPMRAPASPAAAKAKPAAILRPNETPSPDNNSQFTSIVADMNQDGIPDLLLIQPSSGVMHLFLGGSPAGSLQAETTLRQASYYCLSFSAVTVADLNGDGYPDIAYLCGDSGGGASISLLINQGDGTFPDYPTSISEVTGSQLAAGDVNGDGKMDLVLAGQFASPYNSTQPYGIKTFLNTGTTDSSGNPVFSTPGPAQTTATPDIPGTQIVLKDLSNDGNADLALLHFNTATSATEISIFQADGAGGFTPTTAIPVCNCTTSTAKLFVTPLTTANLYPDITVAFPDGASVITARNSRTAALAFAAPATQTFTGLKDAVLGDFNADGFTDLAWYDGRSTSVASGDGTGTFTLNPNFQSFVTGTGVQTAISLAAAPDLNLDGYADLLAVRPLIEENTTTIESYVTTGTAAATLTTSAFTTPGSHNLTTAYPGNLDLLGSAGALTLSFPQITPTITWTPPATTTTTTPVATFLNATANVPGTFTYTYTPANATCLPAGTQTITAIFTPTDTNTYTTATAPRSITVNKTTPTIATTINPASHTYTPNLATTYTAVITGANIVPTGTVQFNNNSTPTGSPAGLNPSGPAQSTTNIVFASLPAGTFPFTATYQGDAVYNPVTSAVTNYTITPAIPTLTYTPTPTTIPYGTGLAASQLNATAADPTTAAAIPGTFTFSTPTQPNLQPGAILPPGTNTLTAAFTPTSPNYSSTTKTATITVNASTSAVSLAVSPTTTAPSGTVVTLTATVTTPDVQPIGQVNFCDSSTICTGSHLLGSAQIVSAGTAILRLIPTIGVHTYTAIFTGSRRNTASTSTPATLTVTGTYPTTTTLTQTGTPGNYTLTATTASTGTLTASPTGLITFSDTSNANAPLATATLTPGTTAQTFPVSASYPTGNYPLSLVSADLNGDGIADLVTANSDLSNTSSLAGTLSVLLGNGDGTFTQKSTITVGKAPFQVVAADFNHDGILDLAAADTNSRAVTVLLGVGDGTFTQGALLPVADAPLSLTVGDFNRDGILDLATANNAGTVSILLGAGDGTFTAGSSSTVGATPQSIASGDFNGDGIADLVTANYGDNTVSILLGNGDGTFTPKPSSFTGSQPFSVVVSDFNGDGIPDLAVNNDSATPATNLTSILLGVGDGTFTSVASTQSPFGGTSLAIADLNNDGIPDLAVAHGGQTYAYLGSGTGTFTLSGTSTSGHEQYGLALADFNGDGLPDIASVNIDSNTASIALNTLTSSATVTATHLAPIGTNPHPVIATYPGSPTFQPSASTPTTLIGQTLTPTITWTPAPLTLGTPLGPNQLNAAATGLNGVSLPGAFIYTPPAGTQLSGGLQILAATFTPADLVDYSPVTATATVRVNPLTTAATLTSTRNPSIFAQSTTLAATISPVGGTSTIPITGPVTFSEGTNPLGTTQAAAGLATLPIATLSVGTHLLTATYAGDTAGNYLPSTATFTQTVARATPTLTFPTPAPVAVGTALSAAQLNATATGVSGAPLPGTFTYTPALGSLVTSGPQTITALFTPTDTTDYTTATITTTLNGTPVTLTALSATTASVGDPAKTITLTGTGFVANSVALASGTPLPTTYVSPTTLTAIVPATALRTVQTLQIAVNDPTQQQTSAPLPFAVTAPSVAVKVTAPTTANPGDQPTVQSTLATAYPVDVIATYTLAFAPITGGIVDPAVQFSTGGTTTSVTIPAGQTVTPNLQLQTGTVAGTITLTLRLTLAAGGTDITPAGLTPTTITIPTVVPGVTSVTLVRSGRQLTVNVLGYSNTRQVTEATFHFIPVTGAAIQTPDTTIDVSALFNGWYSQTASTAYGSTFLYTQVFNLDDDSAVVGQVTVTLSNGVGVSTSGSSQQ